MKRYLITSADERTWKFDRPVIFLGEWCKLYDRKHIWQHMDAIVASPYGLDKVNKDADYAEARVLEEKLFPIICLELNKYHLTQHGERFWRIIFGHWLRHYVDVILNRVKTLELYLQNYAFSGTSTFSLEHHSPCPLDLNEAIWFFNEDKWNSLLYTRILLLLDIPSTMVEVVDVEESEAFRLPSTLAKTSFKNKILRSCYRKLGQAISLLSRKHDAFIINSYLPKKEQFKLELGLGQVPQLRVSEKPLLTKKFDCALRQNLTDNVTHKSSNKLDSIVSTLVFELMPICYIEGFEELTKITQALTWPQLPKFIFTSNSFYADEVFKVWAAHKTEIGIPYYVGQHGNYGVTRYELDPSIEEMTSDKFLTWGWSDGLTQHTPAFIFKTVGRKANTHNPKGGLLLIELFHSLPVWSWDVTAEHTTYFKNQQLFVDKLATRPRKSLTIRLHAASSYLKWNEKARFQAFDSTLKVDIGANAVSELIAQSRLIVHSYDSTGILETLSQNIPTLAFWHNGFDHLRDSAKPFYQLLVDAGIVHFTAESVAIKVNDVWDDVDSWWMQSAVQNARIQFCDRYAVVSKNPIRDLKKILKSPLP